MQTSTCDNSPPEAAVTHYDLTTLQVCVPADWDQPQIVPFAELQWNCITDYQWAVSSYENCGLQPNFVHINLEAQPASPTENSNDAITPMQVRAIHSRVIINIESATDHEIRRTADSFQLLIDYLQMKAAALQTRQNDVDPTTAEQYEIEAHKLHMQLLAQFPGTLIFAESPKTKSPLVLPSAF